MINYIGTMYFTSIFLFIGVIISNDCLGTPLDDYVNTPDPMFSWQRLETYPEVSHTLYILNMTSQKWFDGKYFIPCRCSIIQMFFFSRIFIFTIDLVALYSNHCSTNNSSYEHSILIYWWRR